MSSRRSLLNEWMRERQPTLVDLTDFEELLRRLAPIGESQLRKMLRESGAPLDTIVAGVDQSGLDALAQSLAALSVSYEQGTAEQRRLCRDVVITAKDHARLASRNRRVQEDVRRLKREMVEWMLVWLENPPAFPLWAGLRTARMEGQQGY